MNLSIRIAKRYFFSWKKKTIINIISIFAFLGVAVGTTALIVILSVFNGMDSFVRSLFGKFDSDLVIIPSKGKTFEISDDFIENIRTTEGIEMLSEVILDNALLKYRDNQMVVKIKGIESTYLEHHSMDSAIVQGSATLYKDSIPYALVGLGVKDNLNMVFEKNLYALQFLYPKNKKLTGTLDPNQLLNRENIQFGGTFEVERQYDISYVFVPLEFAEKLTNFENKRTAIEIIVKPDFKISDVKKRLEGKLGAKFNVQDSEDLHKSLYKAHNVEKLITFIVLSFILLIASLNIFFVLSMLVMEKKKDIAIMKSLGFDDDKIYKIYLYNAFFISLIGAAAGIVLGFTIIIIQQQFGLVSMGMSSGLVDSYPVELRFFDFVWVTIVVFAITMLVGVFPAKKASKVIISQEL